MMRGILGAVVLFSTVMTVEAVMPRAQQPAPAQTPPPATPGGEGRGAPTPGAGPGRGGGRGNPAAALYTEDCAGCLASIGPVDGPQPVRRRMAARKRRRRPSSKNIHEGFPQAGMIAFKDQS